MDKDAGSSLASEGKSNEVRFVTKDGFKFKVSRDILKKYTYFGDCADTEIKGVPLELGALHKAVVYIGKRWGIEMDDSEEKQKNTALEAWDMEFMSGVDKPMLQDLIIAAKWLGIKHLQSLIRSSVAANTEMTEEQKQSLYKTLSN